MTETETPEPKTPASKSWLGRFHERREAWLERFHERTVRWHDRWFAHRDQWRAERVDRHARRDERHARKAARHAERHAGQDHVHPPRPTPLQTCKESAHLLLDLPIGIATFTILVTLVSTGVSTLVIIVGFPLLLATAFVVRWIANLERARVRVLLDAPDLQAVAWPGAGEPFLQRLWTCAKDPTIWKEAFYELALMPWGIATFTITVVLWTTAFAGTFFVTYFWALPESYPWYEVIGITVGGLVLMVVGPWIIHGIALLGRTLSAGAARRQRGSSLRRSSTCR